MISQERPGEGSQFTHWSGQEFTALLDSPGHTDRCESAWNKLPEVWEAAGHQPCLCRRLHHCPGHFVSQWDVIPCPQSLCSSPGAPLGTGRGSQVSLLQVNTPSTLPLALLHSLALAPWSQLSILPRSPGIPHPWLCTCREGLDQPPLVLAGLGQAAKYKVLVLGSRKCPEKQPEEPVL